MRKICFLLIFLLLPFLVYAQNIPQATGWVNDFAGVISPEYKDKINALIEELEEKTTAEIAVVTVNSIAPYDEKEYARLLFDNWKPGKKGKDNGVLVLVAVKERRWRIETGYGIEGILPDGLCGEIGRNYMVPYFKETKYEQGLYYGVVAIAKVISKNTNINIGDPGVTNLIKLERQGEKILGWIVIVSALFFMLWKAPWVPFMLLAIALISISRILLSILFFILSLLILMAYYHWKKVPLFYRNTDSGNYGGGYGGGWGGGGFGGGGGGGGGAGGGF